jgi:hypothetical protein
MLIDLPDRLAVFLVIRRRKVEIDSAQRLVRFCLAQNDRNLLIQGDSVAQIRPAVLISLNRFFHQRYEGAFAFLRRFIEANDKLLIRFQGFSNFLLKGLNRHDEDS